MRFPSYIAFILFCISSLHATVTFPVINNITKEYAVLEDGGYMPIGWQSIPENEWDNGFEPYREKGYTQAGFIYKIDTAVLTPLILALGLAVFTYKASKHTP